MSAAKDLLTNYQHVISNLSMVTGAKGVFDVVVNGDLIYSKHQTGRHDKPGEVLELFAAHVGDGVARYGS